MANRKEKREKEDKDMMALQQQKIMQNNLNLSAKQSQ